MNLIRKIGDNFFIVYAAICIWGAILIPGVSAYISFSFYPGRYGSFVNIWNAFWTGRLFIDYYKYVFSSSFYLILYAFALFPPILMLLIAHGCAYICDKEDEKLSKEEEAKMLEAFLKENNRKKKRN